MNHLLSNNKNKIRKLDNNSLCLNDISKSSITTNSNTAVTASNIGISTQSNIYSTNQLDSVSKKLNKNNDFNKMSSTPHNATIINNNSSKKRFNISKRFNKKSTANLVYEDCDQDEDDDPNNTFNNSKQSTNILNNDSMHKFYITRLKHSLINSFLLLIPIQNIFLFLITQFSEMDTTQLIIESITFLTVSSFSLVLMFYLIRNENKLKDYPVFFSLIIFTLITLNHIIPLFRSKTRHLATIEYSSFVIFNIIAIYSILPLPKKLTILLSSIISIKNLLLLSFFLFKTKFNYTIIFKKVHLAIISELISKNKYLKYFRAIYLFQI